MGETREELLTRAEASGHEICHHGHYYMEGSWRWNKGHKQCLICREMAKRRRRRLARERKAANVRLAPGP